MKTDYWLLPVVLIPFFLVTQVKKINGQASKFDLGLSIGYEHTTVNVFDEVADGSLNEPILEKGDKNGKAYRFIGTITYNLTENWSIGSGLQYADSQFNTETDGVRWASDFNTEFDSTKYTETITFQNIELPILFTYKIPLPKGKMPIILGTSINWRLKTETLSRFRTGDGTTGSNLRRGEEKFNNINHSLILKLGYQYPLNESINLNINPTFTMSSPKATF